MKYKTKKNQLFRKKLEMPERVVNKVYNNELSFQEFMEYNLYDKVPLSCLNETHREVVEKFGVEKSKELDWDLIDLKSAELLDTIRDMDENKENINQELYNLVITDMRPRDYTKMMKKIYTNSVLEDENLEDSVQNKFNNGRMKITELLKIWDHVKEKDLSLCLKNDSSNEDEITEEELKTAMKDYANVLEFIEEPSEVYGVIARTYRNTYTKEEKDEYIKKVLEKILDKTLGDNSLNTVKLTNEQYNVMFKYTSISDYLYKKLGDDHAEKLLDELGRQDASYLLDLCIPFDILIEEEVLSFVETYGLENVVNFDEECGHYFTDNNCERLRNMYAMYLHYGANEHDKDKTIFTRNMYDAQGNYVDRPYTKQEFYEAIRRMIVYGPTDSKYADKVSDYRAITGDFRDLNPELFVNDSAPIEFQDAFYTKTLTPIFVRDHYNCISYLIGKKLSTIFTPLQVKVSKTDDGLYYRFENVYKFLEEKLGFEETIKIITDYADVFDVLFGSYEKLSQTVFISPIQFANSDDINNIINKINDKLYELIIKANIKYSSALSKTMKEKYPTVFITHRASKDLHDMFYNREIDAKYLIEHKDYMKYFEGLDIELFFDYIPIVLIHDEDSENSERTIENLILFVKRLFGNEEGLSTLLSYHTYLEKVNDKFGFNKVEFKDNISKEEFLVQIDCLIYLNIIRGDIMYDEGMPNHFKLAYPTLFLSEDTPDDIKNKFYNRLFNLNDFAENPVLLKHFSNTDIACCLDTTFSCMIGLFNSKDFLEVIRICGETIKSDTKLFNYIRSKTDELLNAQKLGEYLFEYFNNNEEILRYLIFLQKLNVKNEHLDELSEMFSKLIKVRPELDVYSPTLNGKLLSKDVINTYGYDVILDIIEYNTGAHNVVIDAISNNDELLPNWIKYLKKLPIYNKEILHSSIINYEVSRNLINELVSDDIELDENQLFNLKKLFIDNNKYTVQKVKDLTNYSDYRNKIIKEKLNSSNINVVRDGIFETLFNSSLSEVNRIFTEYGLQLTEFVERYLIDENILSIEEEAVIEIIREVYLEDDIEVLKENFKDIQKIGDIKDSLEFLENKVKRYYGEKLNSCLFDNDVDTDKGISYSTINGIEVSGMTDINGDYIKVNSEIDIVNLEGIPFNLLVYSQPKVYDKFKNYSMEVIENPSRWNKLKNSPILMNLISDRYLGCVDHCDKAAVYYGFNHINPSAIEFMSRRDAIVEHKASDLSPYGSHSEYMLPDVLQTVSSSYNIIGIKANSGTNSKYNHRIQPDCIVCFDNNISNDSKKAAQYYNIPIYVINRDKYDRQNELLHTKYIEEEVSSIEIEDVKEIFSLRNIDMVTRYDIFSKLASKGMEEKKLNSKKYKSLIEESERVLLAYATHNDLSEIELNEIGEEE